MTKFDLPWVLVYGAHAHEALSYDFCSVLTSSVVGQKVLRTRSQKEIS